MAKKTTEELGHELVPQHEKLSKEAATKVLESYGGDISKLPKIIVTDPAIVALGASPGDVIKITRVSPTAGMSIFYRGVVDE